MNNVIIDPQYINEILTITGYPLIENSDLELTEDQIKSLVILPTLREFYKWFPIQNIQEYSISSNFSIDFPDDNTFNVVHSNLNTAGDFSTVTSAQGNALINSINYTKTSSYGPNMYGTGNSYGMQNAYILKEGLNQSYIDKYKAFNIYTNLSSRKLEGYTTASGKLSVMWAKWSNNFADIPFDRINDVIKLSQANLLNNIIMIRGLQNSDLPNEFNLSLYEDTKDKLETEVMEKWKKLTKSVIIRN